MTSLSSSQVLLPRRTFQHYKGFLKDVKSKCYASTIPTGTTGLPGSWVPGTSTSRICTTARIRTKLPGRCSARLQSCLYSSAKPNSNNIRLHHSHRELPKLPHRESPGGIYSHRAVSCNLLFSYWYSLLYDAH